MSHLSMSESARFLSLLKQVDKLNAQTLAADHDLTYNSMVLDTEEALFDGLAHRAETLQTMQEHLFNDLRNVKEFQSERANLRYPYNAKLPMDLDQHT
ncbi:hypothetical protein HDU97_005987 [Phlyctochytrium planicorne]|nr:hypothetical protein HDU97_005987 [Phlyctochytrium planicorne]